MMPIYSTLHQYVLALLPEIDHIPEERKKVLADLQGFIRTKIDNGEKPEAIFICTHNSRRSHFGQIWAQTFAYYFGISSFNGYSGGTQSSAFNPNAIRAVEKAGFHVIQLNDGGNPLYRIRFNDQNNGITAFSKIFTHPANPQKDFCAVMTCSDADEICPFIPGAEMRLSTHYEDPKVYDRTPLEEKMYAERCRQVATELAWVFKGLAQRIATT